MRLISLSASESSFKPIVFNKSGVSFILAKQENPEQHDNSKTYNGVGKSLLVALTDFCLGASTRNKITKSLQKTLPDWFFILNVEINVKSWNISGCWQSGFTLKHWPESPSIIMTAKTSSAMTLRQKYSRMHLMRSTALSCFAMI